MTKDAELDGAAEIKTEEISYHEDKSNEETRYSMKRPNGYNSIVEENDKVSLFTYACIDSRALQEVSRCCTVFPYPASFRIVFEDL